MLSLKSKTIQAATFFDPPNGIQLFKLVNKNGMEAVFTNYGIRLVSLFTPDHDDVLDDIVLGYDTLEEYQSKNPFMNAIIGRVANRIANGRFEIDGQPCQLNTNDNQHCLHGGANGLHMQTWEVLSANPQALHFYHFSKSGSEGFPGDLTIHVFVELTDEDELTIKYQVETNRATPVNLTYHPFFNLTGRNNKSVTNHLLQINADAITATDASSVATGQIIPVKDSPFDFKVAKIIGKDINSASPTIQKCGGYDHNFILNQGVTTPPFLAATLSEPNSRRSLEIWTTQPGLQLYTNNHVQDIGKGNLVYGHHSAVCLEPQHFPNAPNIPHFPTTILLPNQSYVHTCRYKFGVI